MIITRIVECMTVDNLSPLSLFALLNLPLLRNNLLNADLQCHELHILINHNINIAEI